MTEQNSLEEDEAYIREMLKREEWAREKFYTYSCSPKMERRGNSLRLATFGSMSSSKRLKSGVSSLLVHNEGNT